MEDAASSGKDLREYRLTVIDPNMWSGLETDRITVDPKGSYVSLIELSPMYVYRELQFLLMDLDIIIIN